MWKAVPAIFKSIMKYHIRKVGVCILGVLRFSHSPHSVGNSSIFNINV